VALLDQKVTLVLPVLQARLGRLALPVRLGQQACKGLLVKLVLGDKLVPLGRRVRRA
jgi:hypothetical protein